MSKQTDAGWAVSFTHTSKQARAGMQYLSQERKQTHTGLVAPIPNANEHARTTAQTATTHISKPPLHIASPWHGAADME